MSKDHASSSPERQALTSFVSFHAAGGFFLALVKTGLIAWHYPSPFSDRAAPHSRVRTVPEQRVENCRWNSSRRPGCLDSPKISWAVPRREFPANGRTAFYVVRNWARQVAAPSAGRFPSPML